MRRGIIELAIVAAALTGVGIGTVGVVVAPPHHIFVNRATLQDSRELRALRTAADQARAAAAICAARLGGRHQRFVVLVSDRPQAWARCLVSRARVLGVPPGRGSSAGEPGHRSDHGRTGPVAARGNLLIVARARLSEGTNIRFRGRRGRGAGLSGSAAR